MDKYWDRFHAEAKVTQQLLHEWIKPYLIHPDSDKLQEKLSRLWYVMTAGYGGMYSFESERCPGIYGFLAELNIEKTLVLRWQHELNVELAHKRIDLRYLHHAYNACEILVANDDEGLGELGNIKLMLGQYQEAARDLFDADTDRQSRLYWLPLTQAYLAMGHMDQAIELLNRKIELSDYQLSSALALRSYAFELIGDTLRHNADRDAMWDSANREKPDRPLEYVTELDMRAGNFRRILDEIPSSTRSRDGMQTGEVLSLRAKALRRLAEQNCDEQLIDATIECWREILKVDPEYSQAWLDLMRELESQWRYDELIELSVARPDKDIVFDGGWVVFSLHQHFEETEPYWRGRAALLGGDHEEALGWFDLAKNDRTIRSMETAICCFETNDHDRLHASFDRI